MMLEYTLTFNTGSASDALQMNQLAEIEALRRELHTILGLAPGTHVAVSSDEVVQLHSHGVALAEICALLTEKEIASLTARGIDLPAGAIQVPIPEPVPVKAQAA